MSNIFLRDLKFNIPNIKLQFFNIMIELELFDEEDIVIFHQIEKHYMKVGKHREINLDEGCSYKIQYYTTEFDSIMYCLERIANLDHVFFNNELKPTFSSLNKQSQIHFLKILETKYQLDQDQKDQIKAVRQLCAL